MKRCPVDPIAASDDGGSIGSYRDVVDLMVTGDYNIGRSSSSERHVDLAARGETGDMNTRATSERHRLPIGLHGNPPDVRQTRSPIRAKRQVWSTRVAQGG